MKLHTNAALTQKQRQEIKRLYQTGNYTYPALAKQFATTRRTIAKWVKRDTTTDRSSVVKKLEKCCRFSQAGSDSHGFVV
ncbi:helix-turn-helix domain-containing protein [Spirosoma endbachense]